jgi:hypothetical protein
MELKSGVNFWYVESYQSCVSSEVTKILSEMSFDKTNPSVKYLQNAQ